MTCPRDAALAAGGKRVAAHVATCARCRALVTSDARLAELGAALPWRDATESRAEEMRAELLAAAGARGVARRRRLPPVAFGVFAAAAVLLAILAVRKTDDPVAFHGTIGAHAGATWLRASSRPDEIVRLLDGTITVDVTPLGTGERFRVVTGDAEVEVKGTSFEVVADRDRLVAVRVWSGHVRVAPHGGPEVMLAPGGSWAPAPVITASATPTVTPTVAPTVTTIAPAPTAAPAIATTPAGPATGRPAPPTAIAEPAPRPASEAERSYEVAWQALRAGGYGKAAEGFARTAALASPLAEDAAFWRGVALARGLRTHPGHGGSTSAREAFAAFLDRFPQSPRAGEASAMLGWLLVEAGDQARAAARFHAAENDPVDSVRASARRGLEAIPHK